MKLNIEPLFADTYYHIYNRGTNSENIFKEERNYDYFLKKYALYIYPIADTYAYCLLKNHFHLLIHTRSENTILETRIPDEEGLFNEKDTASVLISRAFASLFKSYSQSINKAYLRTGRLFEEPFRRIEVDNDAYLLKIIKYIHQNPQKHGFVIDFKDYPHSSYPTHLLTASTKLKRDEVLLLFGGVNGFVELHLESLMLENMELFMLE